MLSWKVKDKGRVPKWQIENCLLTPFFINTFSTMKASITAWEKDVFIKNILLSTMAFFAYHAFFLYLFSQLGVKSNKMNNSASELHRPMELGIF